MGTQRDIRVTDMSALRLTRCGEVAASLVLVGYVLYQYEPSRLRQAGPEHRQ